MSVFAKFKGLFGRRGPHVADPVPEREPRGETRLTPAEREFVGLRADRLEAEGVRTGNRRMISQARAIRSRIT